MEVILMYADPTRNTKLGVNDKQYVTIHTTGNYSVGADALAHGRLQKNGNVRIASWHETVDDKRAVISHRPEVKCFHSGDGVNGPGINKSYAIEICVNSGIDQEKAYENGAKRAAYWLNRFGLGISRLRQHYDWSGKNCPSDIRKWGWAKFVKLVEKYLNADQKPDNVIVDTTKPAPSKPKPSKSKIDEDGLWGMDTTDALQKRFKTPNDKIVSSQSNFWQKANPGLTTGWVWVYPTHAQGSKLIRAVQVFLKDKGFYKGELDGKAGKVMITALQNYLGTKPDGELWKNSPAIKEMQRRLNKGTFI